MFEIVRAEPATFWPLVRLMPNEVSTSRGQINDLVVDSSRFVFPISLHD